MQNTVALFKEFLNDEQGATAIEYGLVVALISVMIVAGAFAIGTSLSTIFLKISACLKTPTALTCVP
jgi:pilus assembly protein Flp/PilA